MRFSFVTRCGLIGDGVDAGTAGNAAPGAKLRR